MSLGSALRAHLNADAGVIAAGATEVYPGLPTQSAVLPYIVYSGIGGRGVDHLIAASGVVAARMQIDAWALTHDAAYAIYEAIREALHMLNHATMGAGGQTIYVQQVALDGPPLMTVDRAPYGDKESAHRAISEYSIWHAETVPTH